MQVLTDFPERLKTDARLFIGDSRTPVVLLSARVHNQGLVVKLSGIDSPEAAGQLRNQSLYVKGADRPQLPSGDYYHHQLIGLRVVDEADESIGTLAEILQTGANDVYVVRRAIGSDVLLPVIPTVILAIDRDRGLIRVRPLPGLFEEPK